MRVFLAVLGIGLMATTALGAGQIVAGVETGTNPDTGFAEVASSIDLGANASSSAQTLKVWIMVDAAPPGLDGAQAQMTTATPGVMWNPVDVKKATVPLLLNYWYDSVNAYGWGQNPVGSTVGWAGMLEPDGTGLNPLITGTGPNKQFTPTPGGALDAANSPVFVDTFAGGPYSSADWGPPYGLLPFAYLNITIPQGANYGPNGISIDVAGKIFAGTEQIPATMSSLVITPEPISALLLLAGLPMLRRRR